MRMIAFLLMLATATAFRIAPVAAASAVPVNLSPIAPCPLAASRALADIGNALTLSPHADAAVYSAALAARTRAAECGRQSDVVSLDLIAADAASDINNARGRCIALRKAARSARALHEVRAAAIGRKAAGC